MAGKQITITIEKPDSSYEDFEKHLIGALISDFDSCSDAYEIVRDNCFLNSDYRYIFDCIQKIDFSGGDMSKDALMERLKSEYRIDIETISEAVECSGGSVAHVEFFARIILQGYIERYLWFFAQEADYYFTEHPEPQEFIHQIKAVARHFGFVYNKGTFGNFFPHEKIFKPHWLVKEGKRARVIQSKFDPDKGYAWVDGKPITEERLLKMGYRLENKG